MAWFSGIWCGYLLRFHWERGRMQVVGCYGLRKRMSVYKVTTTIPRIRNNTHYYLLLCPPDGYRSDPICGAICHVNKPIIVGTRIHSFRHIYTLIPSPRQIPFGPPQKINTSSIRCHHDHKRTSGATGPSQPPSRIHWEFAMASHNLLGQTSLF